MRREFAQLLIERAACIFPIPKSTNYVLYNVQQTILFIEVVVAARSFGAKLTRQICFFYPIVNSVIIFSLTTYIPIFEVEESFTID